MIVVNVFGIPRSKKYRILSYFYYKFASKDLNVELVTDINVIGKNLNPIEITGKVYHEFNNLASKDVVITDLPLMLQGLYFRENNYPDPDMFDIISNKLHKEFNNVNVLIDDPSNSVLYRSLRELLDKYDINYTVIRGMDDPQLDQITMGILNKLEI